MSDDIVIKPKFSGVIRQNVSVSTGVHWAETESVSRYFARLDRQGKFSDNVQVIKMLQVIIESIEQSA